MARRLTDADRAILAALAEGAASLHKLPGGDKGLVRVALAVRLADFERWGYVARDGAGFYTPTDAGRAVVARRRRAPT